MSTSQCLAGWFIKLINMSEPPLSKKKQQLKGDAEQQQVVVQFVSVEDQELGNELVLDKASTIPMLNEVLGKLQTD